MIDATSIWTTSDRSRWFLVQTGIPFQAGSLSIHSLEGASADVDPEWVRPFEITEDQARRWAKDQLGQTLDELKQGLDETLAGFRQRLDEFNRTPVKKGSPITPDAASAVFDLVLNGVPAAIGDRPFGQTDVWPGVPVHHHDLQSADAGPLRTVDAARHHRRRRVLRGHRSVDRPRCHRLDDAVGRQAVLLLKGLDRVDGRRTEERLEPFSFRDDDVQQRQLGLQQPNIVAPVHHPVHRPVQSRSF
jgi:hypothetical protein